MDNEKQTWAHIFFRLELLPLVERKFLHKKKSKNLSH